jgi:hypothetical protein
MARANWVKMAATQAAANANPTTLTAVSNYASYTAVFGTTGTRLVKYIFTDGAGNWESGNGVLTLSTLSLDRTWVASTLSGGVYVSEGAVPLTSFAGPVTVECGPGAEDMMPGSLASLDYGGGIGGLGNGFCNQNLSNNSGAVYLAGWQACYPFQWTGRRPIVSCSTLIKTAGTAGVYLVGLMEIQSGGGLNLIFNATATTGFDPTVTGIQTLVSPTDFPETFVPPGDYVLQIVNNSSTNPQVAACAVHQNIASGIFGRGSNWVITNELLNNNGATTLATTATGAPASAESGNYPIPDIIFGMAA